MHDLHITDYPSSHWQKCTLLKLERDEYSLVETFPAISLLPDPGHPIQQLDLLLYSSYFYLQKQLDLSAVCPSEINECEAEGTNSVLKYPKLMRSAIKTNTWFE